MILADMNLALEPAWPFSLPTLGLPALIALALLLAALSVWTYLGVKKATWRRVTAVVVLRLLALAVALSMMMRPSFAVTQLQGVDVTKLLVVVDASESMNVAEIEGKPSRWEQVNKLWASRSVQRRLEDLKAEQKIEVVKYLGAEGLRLDDPAAAADGKRTDIGAWLHELWLKHSHEKHLRGIVIFSDGADNGTRFSAQEKARQWRGVTPIHAFGVGNPDDPKFSKDIGLTKLTVGDSVVPVKTRFIARGVAQAPGFKGTEVEVTVVMEDVRTKVSKDVGAIEKFLIKQEKDQAVHVECIAPEEPGEYKLTLRIKPHADESNKANNEISTYVQVIKQKINVLWVDRPRVYEPTHAIRYALAPEQRFAVHYKIPPSDGKGDPFKFYNFDKQPYDVIIIGDLSAQQFSFGNPKVFDKIKQMVEKKTGLLMLGGSETFVKGGWKETALAELLPVKLDVPAAKAEYSKLSVQPVPADPGLTISFLKFDPDPAINTKLWEDFLPLTGRNHLGTLAKGSTSLLVVDGNKDDLVMAATQDGGGGRVAVFAGDSTAARWLRPDTVNAYQRFWKQLVFWLSKQGDLADQIWIKLDKRRINANAAEILDFTFGFKGKDGNEIRNTKFTAKVIGPDDKESPVNYRAAAEHHQQGTFEAGKVIGEHKLVISAKGKEETVHFLVAFDDVEMLRPLAEHETLRRITAAADGRFDVLEEETLLQYLDELKNQVNRESRHKTTHWPDWKRLPATEHARDQLSGLWNSFALVSLLLFIALLGSEWLLRRLWGLV